MPGSEKLGYARNGKRRNRHIDVVVYSERGVPILANEVEINYGGMAINTSCSFKPGAKVIVQMFVDREIRLEIEGAFIRLSDDDKTIIKFEVLDLKTRLFLEQVLRDALLPRLAS